MSDASVLTPVINAVLLLGTHRQIAHRLIQAEVEVQVGTEQSCG